MATTTPNYGWTVPTSTDLVKDGATAIETLGDAIDASMNTALGTKKAGMVLLNTTSFSVVATQDVNDVFSSTYDNYRILVSFKANTSEASIGFRFKTATVDSGSNYQYYISAFGTNGTSYTQSSTGASQGIFGRVGSDNYGGYAIDILSPNLARATTYAGHGLGDGSTAVFTERAVGLVLTNTQYTGIQLRADSNSVSGEMSIYGFNK